MSGLNFNSTDNKPTTIMDDAYTEVIVSDSSTNNNYNITTLTNNLSIKSGNLATFSGFRKKYDGQLLTVTNRIGATRTIVLKHLDEGSNISNQLDLTSNKANNLIISYGCSAVLRYDNTVSKWWLIGYYQI